ncbi:MAG: patatin-like phospholipase family protein, partial [Hydrogenophaga sp.]|nr:patatin-like phospholipase family protein [Hydrogenophaga sp.]
GAMNAVALAAGLMEDGRVGARANLRRLWEGVADASPFASLDDSPLGAWFGPNNPWLQPWISPWQQVAKALGGQFSPYQFNPLNLNPLRDILADTVNFDRVRACHRTQLFIAATHVSTGELRVFRQNELTADMVLASACLPLLFQAVEIQGEAYWDGGYAGNPSLLPLISETDADDLLLVPINPQRRDEVPTQADDILDRANEVTFNASLLKELRTIALIKELLDDAGRPDSCYQRPLFRRIDDLRLHRLDADVELSKFGASSKLQTGWSFLSQLHAIGREAAEQWLTRHRRDIGHRATFKLPTSLSG